MKREIMLFTKAIDQHPLSLATKVLLTLSDLYELLILDLLARAY